VLSVLASQAIRLGGDVWECGVYKGGTALLLAELMHKASNANCKLHLFDTFEGMPETDPRRDLHKRGDFFDTSLATVKERVGRSELTVYHPGFIPNTFTGLESNEIVFAHVDVDIYQSVLDCCAFIVPRLKRGGFIVFDDYGFPSCPGARQAVDEFFGETRWNPLVLSTGQAVIFAS
jgi:O-methyltransferase